MEFLVKEILSQDVKEHLRIIKTTMEVIAGGCTKFLQTLDVSINAPFKVLYREYYDA